MFLFFFFLFARQKNDKSGKSSTNASTKEKDTSDPVDSLAEDVGDRL